MFVMWAVMMVGMMTPSVAPTLLLYARVGRQAAVEGRPLAATGYFMTRYLLAWVGFALIATTAQWLFDAAALLNTEMEFRSNFLGGLTLLGIAVYQCTPLKDKCLKQYQSPLSFTPRGISKRCA